MKKQSGFIICFILLIKTITGQTLKDAIQLTNNEQYDQATEVFNMIITNEPTNATNYFYAGENYLLSDNAEMALKMYEAGAKADPANLFIQIGRAKYNLNSYSVLEMKKLGELSKSDYEKAKQAYDNSTSKTPEGLVRVNEVQAKAGEAEALHQTAIAMVKEANNFIDDAIQKAGPKNAQILIEAADALIHFKNKDMDKAKTFLDRASSLQPKNIDINILFGDIYSELNNGTLAADYYNRALDQDMKSVRAIVNKGRLYKRSTNYEGAAEEFKNAIKIDDAFAPGHRELGEAYYRLGKLEDAKVEYRRYLELSKNNCSARIRYASFLYLSKDYTGALNEIAQLKNCDQKSNTLLRVKTYSLYETKDSINALNAAEELFSKLSEDKLIGQDFEYYGKILSINGQDSLAVNMLRKAYVMDNMRCDLLVEMWKSYDRMKKFSEAAAVMQEKIQNCKGATVTDYFNLGRSYFFSNDFAKAESAFAKVNELSPKYASGWLWRAKANSFLDSTMTNGMAKPYYEKYIEVATADTTGMASNKYKGGLIESYRYLAAYYVKVSKDLEKCKEYLKKILEHDPEDQEAKDGIKSIEYEQKNKKKPAGTGGN